MPQQYRQQRGVSLESDGLYCNIVCDFFEHCFSLAFFIFVTSFSEGPCTLALNSKAVHTHVLVLIRLGVVSIQLLISNRQQFRLAAVAHCKAVRE